MKNIKGIYWILSLFFLSATILITFFVVEVGDNQAGTFLSGLAIVISILAIGMSDKRLPHFKGKLTIWTGNHTKDEEEENHVYKLSFRIVNSSKIPVNDIKIKIRAPHMICDYYEEKTKALRVYSHGYTKVFLDDSFGILGSKYDNDYLHYDLKFKANLWTKDNIYITINGSNIMTTTWSLKSSMKNSLLDKRNTNPLVLVK